MSEEKFKCLHCKKDLNPTAAFLELVAANKRNITKIQTENKLMLIEMEKNFARIRKELEAEVRKAEEEVAKERKVNSLLISDYEKQLTETKKSLASKGELENAKLADAEKLREEVANLRTANKELEKEVEKVQNLSEEANQLRTRLSAIEKELSDSKKGTEEEVKELEAQVEFQVSENKKLIEQVAKKEDELATLTTELSELKASVGSPKPEEKQETQEKKPTEWSEVEAHLEKEKRRIEVKLQEEFNKKFEEMREQTLAREKEILDTSLVAQRKGIFSPSIPMNADFIKQNCDILTANHIIKGPQGIAIFVAEIMRLNDIKANYVCTDIMRKEFKYVDSSRRWVKDNEKGDYLRGILYKPIIEKATQIIKEMELREDRNDEIIGNLLKSVHGMKKVALGFHEAMINFLAPLISAH